MATTIDSLEIKIKSNAEKAAKGIDKLVASLHDLKNATVSNDDLDGLSESIEDIVDGTDGLSVGSKKGASGLASLGKNAMSFAKKATAAFLANTALVGGISAWVKESNEYQENLNLFTASLGEYAKEAKQYAEEVSEVMGIDPAEWLRGQGVFNTLITGFGVAGDKAAFMSKNLTQLAYDLSSFYNLPVEEAMQKLKSGIAGELEPLRSLGYDLSQAKLESIAMSYGINQSVSSMTQAGKSVLRYQAIMTQVTQVQGDMARTLAAPANQLRLLQSAANQAARALGNMFIPALNAILPAAIALLNVIRTVANAIANLFGFQLTDVDYSGLGGAADAAGSIEDSLGGGAGSAKKMRDYLMGIDELNVISQPDTGGGGGAGGGALSDLSNMELTGYDFLGDALSDKIKEIQERLEAWLPIIKIIAANLAVMFAVNLAIDFIKKLLRITSIIGKGGMIGLFAKAKAVVVGLTASFAAAAAITYAFLRNGKPLLGLLTSLAVGFGAVGLALYFVMGPWGLLVAGIGTLAGVVTATTIHVKQLREELVKKSVYDGLGVSIDNVAASFENFASSVTSSMQSVISSSFELETSRKSIKDTAGSIGMIASAVEHGVISAEKAVPRFKEAFEQMESDTKDVLLRIQKNIETALSGSFGSALESLGVNTGVVMGATNLAVEAAMGNLDEYSAEVDEILGRIKKGTATDLDLSKLTELSSKIAEISGTAVDFAEDFYVAMSDISDIDWGDSESAAAAMNDIATAYKQSSDDIVAYYKELDSGISTLLATEDLSFEVRSDLQDALDSIPEAIKIDQGKIDSAMSEVTGAIERSVVGEVRGVMESAEAEWENMNWLEKLFSGGKDNHIRKSVEEYKVNYIDPLVEQLDAINEGLGDRLSGLGDSILFNRRPLDAAGNPFAGVKEAVESALTEFETLGTNAMQGVTNGVTNNAGLVVDATKTAATDALTAYADAQQSHSPAQLYIEQGMFAMQGAAQGVTENAPLLAEALANVSTESATVFGENYANDLMSGIERGMEGTMTTATTSFSRYVSSAVSELAKIKDEFGNIVTEAKTMATNVNAEIAKIKSPTISINFTTNISSVASTIRSTLNSIGNSANYEFSVRRMAEGGIISALASGGIIPAAAGGGGFNTGQLFIAREAGPELVAGIGRGRTAVMNNDQIVESVSNGVYRAVVDAMSTQGQGDSGDIVLMLGDKEVYRAAKRGEKASGYTLTANPSFA